MKIVILRFTLSRLVTKDLKIGQVEGVSGNEFVNFQPFRCSQYLSQGDHCNCQRKHGNFIDFSYLGFGPTAKWNRAFTLS